VTRTRGRRMCCRKRHRMTSPLRRSRRWNRPQRGNGGMCSNHVPGRVILRFHLLTRNCSGESETGWNAGKPGRTRRASQDPPGPASGVVLTYR
jgi:hypothetical protein